MMYGNIVYSNVLGCIVYVTVMYDDIWVNKEDNRVRKKRKKLKAYIERSTTTAF